MRLARFISRCAVALCLASPARADLCTAGAQIGLPVPLTVYGINTQADSVSTRRPLYVAVDVGLQIHPRWQVGARLGGMTLVGVDGSSEANAWFVSSGVQVNWSPRLDWPWRVSIGPSLLRNAVIVDENIRLDTWAWGGRAASGVGWSIAARWTIDVEAGIEAYRPPWNKSTFFNQPLGRTVLATIALGVRWSQ